MPTAAWRLAAALPWVLAAAGGLGPARGQTPADSGISAPVALLQGLDKTTARVSTFEVPVNGTARFGTLQITARACRKKPPTEPPESVAFLEIVDVRPDSPAVEVFSGWMFASSPAVSAMEHPVYDVWVVDCLGGEAAGESVGTQAPKARSAEPAAEFGDFPEDPEGEGEPDDPAAPGGQ